MQTAILKRPTGYYALTDMLVNDERLRVVSVTRFLTGRYVKLYRSQEKDFDHIAQQRTKMRPGTIFLIKHLQKI